MTCQCQDGPGEFLVEKLMYILVGTGVSVEELMITSGRKFDLDNGIKEVYPDADFLIEVTMRHHAGENIQITRETPAESVAKLKKLIGRETTRDKITNFFRKFR